MMRRAAALVLACLLLVGCGTLSNRYSPARFAAAGSPAPDGGVIIFSAGAPERCISFSTFLKLLRSEQSYRDREVALPPVDVYAIDSDFSDHHGFIHVIALPAGDYYLSPWLANPYYTVVRTPRYDFRVRAGEVVYLGEYFQPGRCHIGDASINDKWARDRALVAERNPSIDLSNATTRLMQLTGDALARPAGSANSAPEPNSH
jgi:hypothetical protein